MASLPENSMFTLDSDKEQRIVFKLSVNEPSNYNFLSVRYGHFTHIICWDIKE